MEGGFEMKIKCPFCTEIKDLLKLFWKFSICDIKKHKLSDKDWDSVTPLLPEVDACCVRCGFPFTIYIEKETGDLKARAKYDDGGF